MLFVAFLAFALAFAGASLALYHEGFGIRHRALVFAIYGAILVLTSLPIWFARTLFAAGITSIIGASLSYWPVMMFTVLNVL